MINRCRQKIEVRMMRVFYIRRKRLDGEKQNGRDRSVAGMEQEKVQTKEQMKVRRKKKKKENV